MPVSLDELKRLEDKANFLRHDIVDTVYHAHSGHLGGALSMIDAVTVLYYHVMNIDPKNAKWEDRDRFVMSKGHAGIGFVTVLADLGFVDHDEMKTFNLTGSKLGIHLDCNKVNGLDASTGSLGHGLSIALGMGLAATQLKKDFMTYCMLGDGECNEGSIWEAAMAIANYNAHNVVVMVDRNKAMIDGPTEDVMKLEPFADKWTAFGFNTLSIDGHDHAAIIDALETAKNTTDKPTCIVLNTVKGQGVDFAAGDYKWHYGAINDELRDQAFASLDKYHAERLAKLEEK